MSSDSVLQITGPQFNFIKGLVAQKDWMNVLDGPKCIVVKKVLRKPFDFPVEKIGVTRHAASQTIDALLKCKAMSSNVSFAPLDAKSIAQSFLSDIPGSYKGCKYAIKTPDETKPLGYHWDFYEVKLWKGQKFLNRLQGAPGDWVRKFVPYHEYAQITKLIHASSFITVEYGKVTGPKAAAWTFTNKYKVCSACGAKLSVDTSIAKAMGPVCAKKFA